MSDAKQEERDRELAGKIDALPREIEPRRDLWLGVSNRIEMAKLASKRRNRIGFGVSALTLMFGAIAVWSVYLRPIGPGSANRVSLDSPPPSAIPAVRESVIAQQGPTVLVPEESSYLTALSGLRAQLDARTGKLPPANLKAVNVSLQALDTAIATTRLSLTEHPDDADLRAELDAEYELEIQTINDVLEWTTRT